MNDYLIFFFFFNDTATTEIYTLSLHDALPISPFIFTNTSSKCHCQFEYERIRLIRFRRISAANIGPNLFHQNRTVSWLISIPRSCKRSSTLRSDSGKRTYNITARRMISGDVLKYRNGLSLVILKGYFGTLPASIRFPLTEPFIMLLHKKTLALAPRE